MRYINRLATLALLVVSPLTSAAPTAQASPLHTTITVNTTLDELNSDGDCSLREAIIAANTDAPVDACPAGSGPDSVIMPAGTYTLTLSGRDENTGATGDLDITSHVQVVGAGQSETIIDGNGAQLVDRVIHIQSSAQVTLVGLQVQGGNVITGGGGGILVNLTSTLMLSGSIVAHNITWDGEAGGGGIRNAGSTTLLNSTISSNTVTDTVATPRGGGINTVGTLLVVSSTVSYNRSTTGAGIFVGSGDAMIIKSIIVGNGMVCWEHCGFGGGIGASLGTTLIIQQSLIHNNMAGLGGGIASVAKTKTRVVMSTISENRAEWGGGIYAYVNQQTFTIYSSSIISNTAGLTESDGLGGGIHVVAGVFSQPAIINSTISANSATGAGGGIYHYYHGSYAGGALQLINSTLVSNTANSDADSTGLGGQHGGGIAIDAEEKYITPVISNTIIANNWDGSPTDKQPDCSGDLFSTGYSLIGDTTGCDLVGVTDTNQYGVDPLLGPLEYASNGVPIHPVLPGSPVIDAGNPTGCQDHAGVPLFFDQRQYLRAVDGNGDGVSRCDIGAYEYGSRLPVLYYLPFASR